MCRRRAMYFHMQAFKTVDIIVCPTTGYELPVLYLRQSYSKTSWEHHSKLRCGLYWVSGSCEFNFATFLSLLSHKCCDFKSAEWFWSICGEASNRCCHLILDGTLCLQETNSQFCCSSFAPVIPPESLSVGETDLTKSGRAPALFHLWCLYLKKVLLLPVLLRGADEVALQWWAFFTAMHDDVDGHFSAHDSQEL